MTTRMFPRASIDVLRSMVDLSLEAVGIDCTLYIPTTASYADAEKLDVFAKPGDYEFLSYSAKVSIQWGPSIYKLKKLGLFTEDILPILVWFGNTAVVNSILTTPSGLATDFESDDIDTKVPIDVTRLSYFEIAPEFVPGSYEGVEQFEIVNVASKGMQDAIIRKIYSAVPRRVEI